MQKILFNGNLIECVTIRELAKMCGNRRSSTLRKYEERKILPPANLRSTKTSRLSNSGHRLYTKTLAVKVAEIFNNPAYFKNGVSVPDEAKQLLRDAFAEERKQLSI